MTEGDERQRAFGRKPPQLAAHEPFGAEDEERGHAAGVGRHKNW